MIQVIGATLNYPRQANLEVQWNIWVGCAQGNRYHRQTIANRNRPDFPLPRPFGARQIDLVVSIGNSRRISRSFSFTQQIDFYPVRTAGHDLLPLLQEALSSE